MASVPLVRKGDKGKAAAGEDDEVPESLVSGYGQIVRDAEGNIVDIILPEKPEDEEEEDDKEMPKVEAKTDIAKSEYQPIES